MPFPDALAVDGAGLADSLLIAHGYKTVALTSPGWDLDGSISACVQLTRQNGRHSSGQSQFCVAVAAPRRGVARGRTAVEGRRRPENTTGPMASPGESQRLQFA